MKAVHGLFLVPAVFALAAVGCGKASPEAQLECVNTVDVEFTPGVTGTGGTLAAGFFLVQKSITMTDPGLGGDVPANGVIATVLSPVDFIQICEGDCLDGDGDFAQEQEVTTDENAILSYTLGLAPVSNFEGTIVETFNPQSRCETNVSMTVN